MNIAYSQIQFYSPLTILYYSVFELRHFKILNIVTCFDFSGFINNKVLKIHRAFLYCVAPSFPSELTVFSFLDVKGQGQQSLFGLTITELIGNVHCHDWNFAQVLGCCLEPQKSHQYSILNQTGLYCLPGEVQAEVVGWEAYQSSWVLLIN